MNMYGFGKDSCRFMQHFDIPVSAEHLMLPVAMHNAENFWEEITGLCLLIKTVAGAAAQIVHASYIKNDEL